MISETRIGVMFLKLLFHISLMFAVATAFDTNVYSRDCPDTALNYEISDVVVPVQYSIKVKPYKSFFYGISKIFINIHVVTNNISLHAYGQQIDEKATVLFAEKDKSTFKPWIYSYCTETQVLVLRFYQQLAPGKYILFMKFLGKLYDTNGFVRTNITDEEGRASHLYVTLFDPTGARRFFPCWDAPRFKAKFKISIIYKQKCICYSNMPVKILDIPNSSGETQMDFETTPALPTYLIMIALVEFGSNRVLYDDIIIWYKPQFWKSVEEARSIAKKIQWLLNMYLDASSEISTTRFIGLPGYSGRSTGSHGIAICREKDLFYAEGLDFPGRKIDMATMIATELARQWIENHNSPSWYSQLWLNKGLGLYFGYYILNKIYENWRMMDLFVVQIHQAALYNDIALSMTPITYDYDPFYSFHIYNKAAVMIRMMQHIVTEEVLLKVLCRYTQNVNHLDAFADFWNILKEETMSLVHYDVGHIMGTWVTQRHYPQVHVRRDLRTGYTLIEQRSYLLKNTHDNREKLVWKIPITFTTQSKLNFSNISFKYWLRNEDMKIPVRESDGWIIVNLQQSGYYRVNYEDENWLRIAHYLNSEDYTKIHVLNRAQIIDDAYYFMMEKQVKYSTFRELTRYLKSETDYIPWYSMMNILYYMSPYFEYPESISIKKHMLNILDGLLTYVGYDESPNEDNMKKALRLLGTKWACKFGHFECKRTASVKLEEHLKNFKEHPILPWWKNWTYCEGMTNVSNTSMQRLINKFLLNNDREILEHIACADNDATVIHYLTSISLNPSLFWTLIGDAQRVKIYLSIVKRHGKKDKVLEYILANFDKMMFRNLSNVENFGIIITSLYSERHLRKVSEFANQNSNIDNKTAEEVRYLVQLRLNQINRQTSMFKTRMY